MTRSGYDPRVRLRIWIDGALADMAWIDTGNPEAVAHIRAARDRHLALIEAATAQGKSWLIEVYDPAEPPAKAYQRFGTDVVGMVDPTPTMDLN